MVWNRLIKPAKQRAEPRTSASKSRNPVWSVPVGLQLGSVYALLLTATLALLGWALYAQLEGFLVQNTADRLDQATQPILGKVFPSREGPGWHSAGSSVQQVAAVLAQNLRRSDVAVAVLDAQGATLSSPVPDAQDDPIQMPPLPQVWTDRIKSSAVTHTSQWVVANSGSKRLLVVLTPLTLRPIDGSTPTPLFLEQVTSLGPADAVLNQLRLYILLGIIVGTGVGVVAGLALTRTILRPLDRMVRTAEAIAGGDLDRRLNLPQGRNEIARLGSSFDHMVDRLGTTLQAQRRFVADASHELRTPLTSLEGLSEMLLMGADRGDTRVVQRTVRAMHGELGRLGRLVADLLTLSRLDSAAPARFTPTDVGRLIADVAEQMAPAAETQGVRLVTMCAGPAGVNGEPDKLKQVLLNLVDNALRYTPTGGEVLVSTEYNRTRAEVQIVVQDTGTGIAPEDMPFIFDRFYRGDTSRTRATGNSGLGLAIVHGIIEAHGGSIAVQSEPGKGTLFAIKLPALTPADAPQSVQAVSGLREDALAESMRH